jgi:hypothetical protein
MPSRANDWLAQAGIYTRDEWERMLREGSRFGRMLQNETMWLWVRDGTEAEGL